MGSILHASAARMSRPAVNEHAALRAKTTLARSVERWLSCQLGTAMATKASASRFIVASARSLASAKVSPLLMGSHTST